MDDLRRLLPVCLFAAGIAWAPPVPCAGGRWLLTILAAAIGILASARVRTRRAPRAMAAIALGMAAVLAGGLAAELEDRRYLAPLRSLPAELAFSGSEGRVVRVVGRFEDDPERIDGDRDRAVLLTESLEDNGFRVPFLARVQIAWPTPEGETIPPPLAGSRIAVIARLRLARTFGNPDSFDMTEHLERRGTTALGWVKSARLFETRDAAPPRPSLRVLVRRRFDRIFRRVFDAGGEGALTPEGNVLRASVLGGRTGLDRGTERLLVASGVYHILAVSGLQVAILAGLALGVLRRTPVPPLATLAVATSAVLFYGEIVAPSASVARAVSMAVLAACARLLRRRTPAVSLLGLAAFARLAACPSDLGDPGFQLTFAATAGLLTFGPRLGRHLQARAGAGSLFGGSIAAQAATWPLVAFWFHRFVPYGLASNLLAVPLGSAAVVLGVSLLPADLVDHRLADALGALSGLAVRGLLAVASVPVEGTVLSFRVAAPRIGLLLLAAAGTMGLVLARRRFTLGFCGAVIAGSLVLIVVDPFAREAPAPWTSSHAIGRRTRSAEDDAMPRRALGIDVVDVGQGDAILVRFDDGESMLIDGGGFPGSTFDVGERVLLPELERRGLSRLGRVVLTHAHEDHGGGLREILRTVTVDELLVPDAPQGPLRAELENIARSRGIRVLRIRRGYTIHEGATVVRCLAPFPGVTDGPNADSIVLRIEAGGRSALLTGDIVAATERRLLASGIEPVDVLKIAHHGSDSSTLAEFLSAVSPRAALISVGVANRFGHPSPRVLKRLAAVRALVLRTDRDGAVRVDARGSEIFAGSLVSDRPGSWPGPALRPRARGSTSEP